MTPAPVSMKFLGAAVRVLIPDIEDEHTYLEARPERGAMRPSVGERQVSFCQGLELVLNLSTAVDNLQVPAGTAMLMSVSTRALPRAGMTVALDA